MEEINIKKLFAKSKQPSGWAFCFNATCPMCETCTHFLSGKYMTKRMLVGKAVFPQAMNDGQCQFYKEFRTVRMAYGFNGIMDIVENKDKKSIRNLLYCCTGSKSTFYRMNSGEVLIGPQMQQKIMNVLLNNGYKDAAKFDVYIESVEWD